jgi:hypothetical protein
MRLDAPAEIVNGVVSGDDTRPRRGITMVERVHRHADRIAHQRAKTNDVEPGSF